MKQVTESQMDQMKHALGLNYGKTQTRNSYYTDFDDKDWNDLVSKGLATKHRGWDEESAYFRLTEAGIQVANGQEETSNVQ